MIQRMIENNLLGQRSTYDNIPNIEDISVKQYMDQCQSSLTRRINIPSLICWGTVGILYNKTMVDEPVDSWGRSCGMRNTRTAS